MSAKPKKPAKPFTPAVKISGVTQAMVKAYPDYAIRYGRCQTHVQEWPLTKLEQHYTKEYNSLRSRKQAAKRQHLTFDVRLKDFRDWLIHLGPIPADGWTVDRMNNYRGYEPRNIKWSTKQEQTQNRKVTKWHNVNGKHMTTMQLSKHLGLGYTRVYKRLQRGWSVDRLLEEQKKHGGIKAWNFPPEAALLLEPLYAQRKPYNQSRLDWYIAYLKKWIQEFENAAILSAKNEKDVLMLYQKLDMAAADLKKLLQEQREQDEAEVTALIAAFEGPSKFLHFPGFVPPVSAPAAAVAAPEPNALEEKAMPASTDFKYPASFLEQINPASATRWENVEFLAQFIMEHCPEDPLFSTNPFEKGEMIFDDQYQGYVNAAYQAAASVGLDAVDALLHECADRGIPPPAPSKSGIPSKPPTIKL
jgi:hypothetical protein